MCKKQRRSQLTGVGSKDDNLGDTTVEGLGSLVGTLLQLAVVGSLLDEVEDLLAESLVGLGPCGAGVGHCRYLKLSGGWCRVHCLARP